MSAKTIKPLTPDEYRKYFSEIPNLQNPRGATISIGIFVDSKITGGLQICRPISELNDLLYSSEVVNICVKSSSDLDELLLFYIDKSKPADFFSVDASLEYLTSSVMSTNRETDIYEWVDTNRTYYTYRITASDSQKYYYGVSHVKITKATVEDCLNDGYFGTGGEGKTNKFNNWKKKHSNCLQKEVLELFTRKSEAFLKEEELIGDLYKTDKLCLNSTSGGKTGGLRIELAMMGFDLRECLAHGSVMHNGLSCLTCSAESRHSMKVCPIHGEANHSGESCLQCVSAPTYSTRYCEIHGETTYRGDTCAFCSANKSIKIKYCEIHGDTKFKAEKCYRCIQNGTYNKRNCTVHGETTFRGTHCVICTSKSNFELKSCEIHGETTFRGDSCMSCKNQATVKIIACTIHGEVKSQNSECPRCRTEQTFVKRLCKIHGESKFRGDSCVKCLSAAKRSMKHCSFHGETLHQGNSCFKCVSAKSVHARSHVSKNVVKEDCILCN